MEVILHSVVISAPYLFKPFRGGLRFDGERPGPDWHAHGWFSKSLVVLVSGVPTVVTLFKRRWRLKNSNITRHSRPPTDPCYIGFCSLIIVLRIWAWLSSARGFFHRVELLPGLEHCGSDRCVKRWIARALRCALSFQQTIRQMVLSKYEPRPEQDVLCRGRDPPQGLLGRCQRTVASVSTLWRAFDWLFVTAKNQSTDVSLLLVEARRRWLTGDDIFPL
jgi:hypothetical protein